MNAPVSQSPNVIADEEVAIIGTGFSGLCMAIKLKQAGIDRFVMLESASEVGGTWRDNTYPGCGCDVASAVYSFSFDQNPDWSRRYSDQPEIWNYMRRSATRHGVRQHCRFNTRVVRASWDAGQQRWLLETADGQLIRARSVVSGVGLLRIPQYPDLPGLSTFQGHTFHSTRWDHGYDLRGKRVAVIGTGASAIQFVPQIQPQVQQLHLFQRSPPWVFPKPDRPMKRWEKILFRLFPPSMWFFRAKIFLSSERRLGWRFADPASMEKLQVLGKRYLEHVVPDAELRKKVTPDYAVGCKRILLSNDYYPALARSNVEVVTNEIAEVRARSIVCRDGTEREVDAIIYATGFRASELYSELKVTGRDGRTLDEVWAQGPEAYYGVAVSGFPNFFMLHGPNTGTGHNSAIFMIEAQVGYVMRALKRIRRRRVGGLEIRPDVQAAFNRDLQEKSRRSVWGAGGCGSWYFGKYNKNTTLWPGLTLKFWLDLRRRRASEFIEIPAGG